MLRLVAVAVGLAGLAITAEAESKLDSITFRKLVMGELAKTNVDVVAYVQKKYGYDSQSFTFKIREGSRSLPNFVNVDLELDHEAAATPNSEGEEESEESDWKKKERVSKEDDAELIKDLDIDVEELPIMAIFRKGKIVDRLPIKTGDIPDTQMYEVENWLSSNGILLSDEKAPLMPEFEPVLQKFADANTSETWQEIISEADALVGDASDEDKAKIYVKVLKNAIKNGEPKAYIAKELKRVMSMLSSDAVAMQKKQEMRTKVGCLKSLSRKMEL